MKQHISAYVLGAMLIASISPVSAAPQSSTSTVSQKMFAEQPASSIVAKDRITVLSEKAGFELHFPSYMPGVNKPIDLIYSDKNKHIVGSFFSQSGLPFYLEMWKGDILVESKGLTAIQTKKGTAYHGTQKDLFGEAHVLVWEEQSGIIYRLISNLSQEELVKIAESVKNGNKIALHEEAGKLEVINGLDTKKASELFGSTIKIPAYLPSGVAKEKIGISGTINNNGYTITLYDQASVPTASYFSLELKKGSLSKEDISNDKTIQLVQGTGYLGTAPLVSFMHPELKQLPVLTWEKDGVVYELQANTSVEELKKVAESLSMVD